VMLVRSESPSTQTRSTGRAAPSAVRRRVVSRPRGGAAVLAAFAVLVLLIHASPSAAAEPLPYQTNDYGNGGFHDILPPGQNGLTNVLSLALFKLSGTRPAHSFDQYPMYASLLYQAPGLSSQDIPKYFKDSSFGVPPGHIGSVERPRDDGVIVRDSDFGIPHIYGSTRAGAEFAAGFAAAEDRLFEMDALRHAGRGQLAGFAGGSPGNRAMDQSTFINAPYTEAELQRQVDLLPQRYGADGQQVVDDATSYVAGINLYIDEAKLNLTLMPAEYPAINRPLGPDPWKLTDLLATATLIGGILGQGGGNQLSWAQILVGFRHRFG
jgi:hypothetical protein